MRMIQPEEAWIYSCHQEDSRKSPVLSPRNPMTESYVSGSWLWRMVVLVPIITVTGVYAVSGRELWCFLGGELLVDHQW